MAIAAAIVWPDNQWRLSTIHQNNVNLSSTTRAKWELTAEAFAKLLAGFDPNPERAGAKYESIRTALLKFFDWQGAFFPEELADETFNRVARKLDEGAELQDPATYCHGVARLVLLESRKRAENRHVELDETIEIPAKPETDAADERQISFERCLNELPIESRQLVLRYYQSDKRQKIDGRQTLATQLGIPLNALRSRVQRIRDRLEQCVKKQLSRKFSTQTEV